MLSRDALLPVGLLARACFAFLLVAHVGTTHAQTTPAPQAGKQQPPFRYWTTSWSFEEIDLRDLTGKLASIGVELPIEMSGTASVNFDVSIPLNGLKDPKAYKFRGSLSSPRLRADNVVLEKFAANVNYSDGIIRLTDLRGKQGSGSFAGSATGDVAAQGAFQASLKIEQLDLGPIAQLLAKLGIGRQDKLASGTMDGDVNLAGTLSKMKDVASWDVTGTLRLHDIAVGDSVPYSITIDDLVLRAGRLVVPAVSVQSSALPEFFLKAAADVQLDGTQKFLISLQADDVPATDLMGLYFDSPEMLLSGKLDLKGNATGELNPQNSASPTLDIQLELASPSIQVLGVDLGLLEHRLSLTSRAISLQPLRTPDTTQPLTIESIEANYQIDPQQFQVKNLAAKLFGGTFTGNATLARQANGEHRLDAVWNELELNIRLPFGLGGNPVRLSAATTGKAEWSVPANKVEFPAFHRADVAVKVDSLNLGTESLGSLDVDLKISDAGFDLRGQGRLFGGRVELTSTSPLDPTVRWTDVPKLITGGQLLFSDVSVANVIQTLAKKNPRRFSGKISGTTDLTIDQDNNIASRSRWIVRNFGVDGTLLSRRLDADVSTLGTGVHVRSIKGNYAGGQVQATGQWSLAGGPRIIDARMVHGDSDRMLLPLHSSADQWIGGKFSGRASIVGYGQGPLDDLRISGAGRLIDGQTFDIPIGNAHTPFRVLVKRSPLSWQADLAKVRSELAQGQVHGDLHVSSSSGSRQGFDLESHWRLNHVEFEQLLHTYAGTKTLGRGLVAGRFALSGRNIRSLNDLEGEFRMTLGGTDVTAVPGLWATSSLLGAASLAGTKFNEGEAVGRISHGSVALEQLVLLSDRLKVISSGRVGLQGGRIDMVTMATTGNFSGQYNVLEGIAPQALLSVSPVSSFNRLISDRTVIVDMVGTLRDPQIRLRAGETLQANMREFLIRQLTGQLAVESALLKQIDW